MAEDPKKADVEKDPRRVEGAVKIPGGRYEIDPKTGAAARTEGLGLDDDAARKGSPARKRG